MAVKNSNYIVYKNTSPSNKVYIGITGQANVNRRWQGGRNYKNNNHFNNAIKKYGWDNIKHEILFDGLTKDQAEEKEKELIKSYKSNNPKYGYNIESGGNATKQLSEETKKKISDKNKGKPCWLKGKKMPDETKAKISKTEKGRVSPMKNRHWTIEQRAKVGKHIVCVETGEHFYSIRDASRKTGCDRANISRVLKGEYKQTKGLSFSYE